MSSREVNRVSPIMILACFLLAFLPSSNSQVTRPTDVFNCRLNSTSPFSYMVRIWDRNGLGDKIDPGPAAFGVLITHNAMLSTAWYFWNEISDPTFHTSGGFTRYEAVGHNIWNTTSSLGRITPCYQFRNITDIQVHPKAKLEGERMFFDFSFVKLKEPFLLLTEFYPAAQLTHNALDLLLHIRYVNTRPTHLLCGLPVPSEDTGLDKYFVINDRIDVKTLPVRSTCVQNICGQPVPYVGRAWWFKCVRKLESRLNATYLCMAPRWTTKIFEYSPPVPSPLAGVPLVCNGTTLAILSQVKYRRWFYYFQQDFYYLPTLLRVYPWVSESIRNVLPSSEPFFLEEKDLRSEKYPKPARKPTPDWGKSDFFSIPPDFEFPEVPALYSLAPDFRHRPSAFFVILVVMTVLHQNTDTNI